MIRSQELIMHNVADVEVQKNIMDANKRLATFSVLILLELLVPVKLH